MCNKKKEPKKQNNIAMYVGYVTEVEAKINITKWILRMSNKHPCHHFYLGYIYPAKMDCMYLQNTLRVALKMLRGDQDQF